MFQRKSIANCVVSFCRRRTNKNGESYKHESPQSLHGLQSSAKSTGNKYADTDGNQFFLPIFYSSYFDLFDTGNT